MKVLGAWLIPERPRAGHALLLSLGLLALRLGAYGLVTDGLAALPRTMCQWDCGFYLRIASAGYDLAPTAWPPDYAVTTNWAFLPAFPGLIAALAALTHWPLRLCGLVVANAAFAGFVLVGVRYLAMVRPGTNQGGGIWFLMAFPFGFYFSLPYTESLYALLAMSALLALERGGLMTAGLVSAGLMVTRVTGVLLWPVLAWTGLAPAWRAWRAGDRHGAWDLAARAMPPLAIAPLGVTGLMAYFHSHVGDALAFAHAQACWFRHFVNPFAALLDGLLAFDVGDALFFHGQSQFLCALSGCLVLVMSVRLALLRRYRDAWFLAATVLMAASSGLISLQRFVWANPVMLLFLFDWLWQGRARRLMAPLLLVCAAVQLYLVYCWGAGRGGLV
ncbi:hypothetical protein [Acidocella sp.]|uniref:hypothetical protein n=1 Tax=Acidocella sp. TaxID=50710 RepID=UPI00260B56E4|nr:hypothetical protein [Acidocella sp.]